MSEQNFNEVQDTATENEIVTDTPVEVPQNPEETRKRKLLSVIDYIEIFAIGVCAVLILFSFVFRICTVDGDSMNNTLHNGEKLIISDMF